MYKSREFSALEKHLSADIRNALEFAESKIRSIKDSREKDIALMKLEETMLWANIAIATSKEVSERTNWLTGNEGDR